MLKKRLAMLGVVAVIACAILIPSVRGAAESVLSVFRVGDTKTITVTVNDLQDMMTYLKDSEGSLTPGSGPADDKVPGGDAQTQMTDKAMSQTTTLSSVRDFTAFPFSLPTSLKSETPKLLAIDAQSKSMTLDTAKINAELQKLGAAGTVASSYNGTNITVNTPAAIAAEYQAVTLIATQNVYIDAPAAVMNSLWSAILSIPAIPDDLRAQLSAIDPQTRDIYLPVIEGLGRETDLGGTTGYIYATTDLSQVISMLPGLAGNDQLTQLQNKNASALIWTKNGVLYCLVGTMTDSELAQVARSIR